MLAPRGGHVESLNRGSVVTRAWSPDACFSIYVSGRGFEPSRVRCRGPVGLARAQRARAARTPVALV